MSSQTLHVANKVSRRKVNERLINVDSCGFLIPIKIGDKHHHLCECKDTGRYILRTLDGNNILLSTTSFSRMERYLNQKCYIVPYLSL